MRLINATTLEVVEFFDGHAPKYGILSHRWVDGEITLQEMQAGTAATKPGYQKVAKVCQQVLEDGLGYAWVDTCCIDKTSSAELTEAINSMYRWYHEAAMCYAFLNDVTEDDVTAGAGAGRDALARSMWFTRGWTLQELIAPAHVKFYNLSWREIGTRASLREAIAAITLIDAAMLEGGDLESFSIAQRMSWASRRVTTRAEDMGYCLLGIFGVNMPMLYGEGERAFTRLQEEIMKNSDDHSLFAWSSDADVARGLLARSPRDFINCADVYTTAERWNQAPYAISNLGLSIELPMVPWVMDTFLAALDCARNNRRLGIFLRMLPQERRYARVMVNGEDRVFFTAENSQYRNVFVQQRMWGSEIAAERFYGFWMRTLPEPLRTAEGLGEVVTRGKWKWDDEDRIFKIPTGKSGTAGAISLEHERGPITIKVGFDGEFNPHLQFGGRWQSPDRFQRPLDPLGDIIHTSWIDRKTRAQYDGGHLNFVHRGTRLAGLLDESHEHWLAEDGSRDWRFHVFNGLIPKTGRMGWVVDIERWDSEHRGKAFNCICDGCESYIYGMRYKCTVCEDFDYCAKCVVTAGETHAAHQFEALK